MAAAVDELDDRTSSSTELPPEHELRRMARELPWMLKMIAAHKAAVAPGTKPIARLLAITEYLEAEAVLAHLRQSPPDGATGAKLFAWALARPSEAQVRKQVRDNVRL